MSLSLFTALPPSRATLRNVFQNTSRLSSGDIISRGLCNLLNIPDDKWDVDSATEYYSNSTDQRKMRKMIFNLDEMGDTALADSVMEFAEPQQVWLHNTIENTTQPVN